MKIINKIVVLAACIAALAFQTDSFAKSTSARAKSAAAVQELEDASEVVEAIASTERGKIEAATLEVAQAEEALKTAMESPMSPVEKAKTVGTLKYELEQAKSQLAELVEESTEKVKDAEAEESYISQFVSGVRGLGGRAAALFSYTQEEQGIAKAIIAECVQQMETATIIYQQALQTALSDEVKAQLDRNHTKTMNDFKNQIAEQQVITGEKTSWNRIAFWTSIGLAGAVLGGVGAQKYFAVEAPAAPQLEPEQQQEQAGKSYLESVQEGMTEFGSLLGQGLTRNPNEAGIITPGMLADTQEMLGNAAQGASTFVKESVAITPASLEYEQEKARKKMAEKEEAEAAAERKVAEEQRMNESRKSLADKRKAEQQAKKDDQNKGKTFEQIKKSEYAETGLPGALERRAQEKKNAPKITSLKAYKSNLTKTLQETEATLAAHRKNKSSQATIKAFEQSVANIQEKLQDTNDELGKLQ